MRSAAASRSTVGNLETCAAREPLALWTVSGTAAMRDGGQSLCLSKKTEPGLKEAGSDLHWGWLEQFS